MADSNFAQHDLIAHAQARFDALANYEVTLRSASSAGALVEARYRYLKPGFVRVDFIQPHAGAVLAYSPKTGEATLWPFGAHRFPKLAFPPDHPMIKGPNGHRIDRSDIGTLLGNVREIQCHGQTQVMAQEAVGARHAAHLTVTGERGYEVGGVLCYQLWLDLAIGLPIKVVSSDASGNLIETVLMDDLRVDQPAFELF